MRQRHVKHNIKSIIGKVAITFLLACAAITASIYLSRITFRQVLSTVDMLSQPNENIQLVNNLFRDVVRLEHLQRSQVLQSTDTTYNFFPGEVMHIDSMLSVLEERSQNNPSQVERIKTMKELLVERDSLLVKYAYLQAALVGGDFINGEVKNMTSLIRKARYQLDSNLISTQKATKIIIDTLDPEPDKETGKKSIWNKLFQKKKKKPTTQILQKTEEITRVKIDTVSVGNSGARLTRMGAHIVKAENKRIEQRQQLLEKQMRLNRSGDLLVTQLLTILNDIENAELQKDARENELANERVQKSLVQINWVLLAFIAAIGILTMLIFADIWRSNRYRKQLVAAKEEAEQAGMVKQRFLSNMSHELRTPLQTIIGISEQVLDNNQPEKSDLENIHGSSLHLLQIVNEILDYSRVTSGKFSLDPRPFKMYELLTSVKEMIQVQAGLKHIAFYCDFNVPRHTFYIGDAFRLRQILLNLLGNAVKFTDEGTVSLQVTLSEQENGISIYTFIIKDTGIGIAKDEQSVIFNQFEQGKNLHKKPGTGLGLSIVKLLTELQAGTVEVNSEEGKGTAFTVTIPYTETNINSIKAEKKQNRKGYNGHVWMVDDDIFILQLCDSILTKYEIPHTCFRSGTGALEATAPADLSIVFLDMRMAGMDGVTTCAKLKEKYTDKNITYVALTAQVLPDEREDILKDKFDKLVMKPFLEQDLLDVIQPGLDVEETSNNTSMPATDFSEIYKMAGEDLVTMKLILTTFARESEDDLGVAEASQGVDDPEGIANMYHKLASRYGQLGFTEVAHNFRILEIALRDAATTEDFDGDIAEVHREAGRIITDVKAWLSTDSSST